MDRTFEKAERNRDRMAAGRDRKKKKKNIESATRPPVYVIYVYVHHTHVARATSFGVLTLTRGAASQDLWHSQYRHVPAYRHVHSRQSRREAVRFQVRRKQRAGDFNCKWT